MTTEPFSLPGRQPDLTKSTASSQDREPDYLRRRLRIALERHLATHGFRPALTVIGFNGNTTTVLRQGVDHPEDAVLEFVLPSEYSAVGILASSVVATPPVRGHDDAALALGVTRGGAIVSLLATRNGVADTREPQGWLIDACLRAVNLDTPACETAAIAFLVALWLDRLMVVILNAATTEPVEWDDAVALCPIPQRWRSSDPIDVGTTLGATARSWSALRTAAIDGSYSPLGMTAERARWMDDAMFARWCMGSFPDLANLRADVEFLAPPPVAERIELALRAAWIAHR